VPALEQPTRVLVVDDDPAMGDTLADGLREHGYEVVLPESGAAAMAALEGDDVDVLVTDLRMPDVDGLELVARSRKLAPERPVIVMTAYGAIDSAVESIRLGAYQYLTKPFKLDQLALFIERALDERKVRREAAALRTTLRGTWSPQGVVGRSRAMRGVLDVIARVASTDVPVLLLGETGTGKGMIAKLLHSESARASRAFVAVNCAALPDTLLESELFGHVRGAFTGATADSVGLFAEANGGTIFLDEIGDLPLALQAKLLHVLESRSVRPVGSTRERPVDVRILSATNRNLRERVKAGTFREDLLYRLEVVPLRLPSLRERRDDLPTLIPHFLEAARLRYPTSPVQRIGKEALTRMLDYDWPGNVRELRYVVERLVVLGRGPEVGADELPAALGEPAPADEFVFGRSVVPMRELQRRYVAWALEQCGGHRGKTAEKLDIDPKTLSKWIEARPESETG